MTHSISSILHPEKRKLRSSSEDSLCQSSSHLPLQRGKRRDFKLRPTMMNFAIFIPIISLLFLPMILGEGNSWERPPGMPHISQLEVMCGAQHMEVHLSFDSPFHGIVASKGMYGHDGCVYVPARTGQSTFVFNIYYDKCGTKPDNNGKFYENTVVVQYDEELIEAWDEAKRLRCEWFNDYEKTATKTSPMVISDLDIVELNFHGDNVDCWMEIQEGKGPWAPPLNGIVPLGSTLTMVVAVKDPTGEFDMRVKACEATDGNNGHILQLSDPEGCIVRPKLIGKFSKIKLDDGRATVLTYAFINAFKFPDMLNVHLRCTVEICRHGCPDHCQPHGPSSGHKKEAIETNQIQGEHSILEPIAYESQQNSEKVNINEIPSEKTKGENELTGDSEKNKGPIHVEPSNNPINLGPELSPHLLPPPPFPTQNIQRPPRRPPPQIPPHLIQKRPMFPPQSLINSRYPTKTPPFPQRPFGHQVLVPHPHPGGQPPHFIHPQQFQQQQRPPHPQNIQFQQQQQNAHQQQQIHEQNEFQHYHQQPQQQQQQDGKTGETEHKEEEEMPSPRNSYSSNAKPEVQEAPSEKSSEDKSGESLHSINMAKQEALTGGATGSQENVSKRMGEEGSLDHQPIVSAAVFPKGPRNLRLRRSVLSPSDVIGVQGAFKVISQADLNFALNASVSNTVPLATLKGRMSNPEDAIYGICLPRVRFGIVFFGLGFATLAAILIAVFLAYAHYQAVQSKRVVCHQDQIPPIPHQQVFPLVIFRKMW